MFVVARYFDRIGFAPSAEEIMQVAHSLTGHPFCLSWAYAFMKDHEKFLVSGHGQAMAPSRHRDTMLWMCEKFAADWDREVQQRSMSAKGVINFDEKLVVFRGTNCMFLRALRPDGTKNVIMPKDIRIGSLVSFASADGELVAQFWILKVAVEDDRAVKKARVSLDRMILDRHYNGKVFFMLSRSGYLDESSFYMLMSRFINLWKVRYSVSADTSEPSPRHCFLLCDQLRIHRSLEVVLKLVHSNMYPWYFPTMMSYPIQPLDNFPHANFEHNFNSAAGHYVPAALERGQPVHQALQALAQRAALEAMQPPAVIRAFENCHVWPWNRDELIAFCSRELIAETSPAPDRVEEVVRSAENAIRGVERHHAEQVQELRETSAEGDLEGTPVHTVFSGEELLRQHKLRLEAQAEAAGRVKRLKEMRQESQGQGSGDTFTTACAVGDCPHKFRGGQNWEICACYLFVLCPSCSTSKEKKGEAERLRRDHRRCV